MGSNSKKKIRFGLVLLLGIFLHSIQVQVEGGTSNELGVGALNGINGKSSYYANSYMQNAAKNLGNYAQIQNRDSYTDAAGGGDISSSYAAPIAASAGSSISSSYGAPAVSGGYGGGGGGGGEQQMYHYQLIPNAAGSHPMASYGSPGGDYDDDDDEEGGGGGSEFACLAGLLGLKKGIKGKGIKGLKALKALKVIKGLKALKGIFLFPLFLPLLLPILLPLLIIPLALLLLLPIPIITVPSTTGRKISSDGEKISEKKVSLAETARMAKDVLTSGECIERISCEVSQFAKGYKMDKFIEKAVEKIPGKTTARISRAIKSEICSKFTCDPIGSVKRMLNMN